MSNNESPPNRIELPQLTADDLPPDALSIALDLNGESPDEAGFDAIEESTTEVATEESSESTETPPASAGTVSPKTEVAEPAPSTEEPLRVSRAAVELEERSRALATQEAELKAHMASLQPYVEIAEMAKRGERLNVLDKLGMSYEQITQDYVNGEGPTPNSKMQEELAALRTEVTTEIQQLRQLEYTRRQASDQQFIADMVTNSNDKFVHVAATGAQNLVQETVTEHFNRTGQILSHEDAAVAVEEGLAQLFETALKNPVIREKYAALLTATTPKSPDTTQTEVTSTTLANEDTQDSHVLADADFDFETASDEESIEHLVGMLKYQ